MRSFLDGVEVIPLIDDFVRSQGSQSLHSERVPSPESDDTETVDSRGESEVDEDAIRGMVPDTVEDADVDSPQAEGRSPQRSVGDSRWDGSTGLFREESSSHEVHPEILAWSIQECVEVGSGGSRSRRGSSRFQGLEVVGHASQNVASPSTRRGQNCEHHVGGSIWIVLAW